MDMNQRQGIQVHIVIVEENSAVSCMDDKLVIYAA